jgi:hypothetical protein
MNDWNVEIIWNLQFEAWYVLLKKANMDSASSYFDPCIF